MTNTNIYTRLNNLVCALRADEDNCDLVGTVRDTVDSCRNYVGMVDRMEANIRTARETMDAEDFRRRVQTLDMNRRTAHEGLMIDVNMLNKICANIGISLSLMWTRTTARATTRSPKRLLRQLS